MKLRAILVDDEKMARRRLSRLLDALGGVDLLREYASAEEAMAALTEDVDVAFLDVDMPGMNGLEVAQVAALRGVAVVFVTAHEKHAVEAFQQGAVHYLLKPVDAQSLEKALARVRQATHPRVSAESPARIALTVRGDVVLVPLEDITHATFDGHLISVFVGETEHLLEGSLAELETRLVGDDFVRVHRRAVINLAHVQRLRALDTGGYLAVMPNGAEVPVSRQSARALRKQLGL